MDSSLDLEALRRRLGAMSRKDVLALCLRAKVSASTVQKFRKGHTDDIGGGKTLALMAALQEPQQRKQRDKARV